MSNYDKEEVKQLLDDCTAPRRTRYSNEWEKDFLATCHEIHNKGTRLSARQLNTLNRTWEKVTANG